MQYVYDVDCPCTICCTYAEVSTGGPNPPMSGTPCNRNAGPRRDCDYLHRDGYCLANNPGYLVQLELDTTGSRAPGLNNHGDQCEPDNPDLRATCFDRNTSDYRENELCPMPNRPPHSCRWPARGC